MTTTHQETCIYCKIYPCICKELAKGVTISLEDLNDMLARSDKGPIEKHPEYQDLIDAIEEWGNKPFIKLVDGTYDQSGNSHTKAELFCMSRGKLLAMLIDGLFEC